MGLDGLKGLAKKKTPGAVSQKSKGVVLTPTDDIAEVCDKWKSAQRQMKDAQATMTTCEEEILDFAQPRWRDACRSSGTIETSAKMHGIRISWKGKSQFVTKTSLGDGQRTKEVFGDQYKKYFAEVDGPMELTKEAVSNPAIVAKLQEVAEELAKEFPDTQIFTYSQSVTPTDTLYNDWVVEGEDGPIEDKLRAAAIKRTKPTIAAS